MIGRLLSIGAAFALLAGCMPTPPTDISVRTYAVSGRTSSALERSVSAHGPTIPGMQGRAFAAVETEFLPYFAPQETQGGCRFNRDGRVALRSEVILPEWRQRETADPELREKWDILAEYAVIHEAGHIRISQKYALQLESAFRAARAPNCTELDAKIVENARTIFSAHRAEQLEFDRTDLVRFRRFLNQRGYTTDG
jgi:predicted secreted Zn-dependent protease